MKKTAMELALARIELMKDISPDSIHWQMFKENYIQQEKEQIIHTYWVAYKEGRYSGDKTAEEYYNETFNQDRELGKEVTELLENYKNDKTFKQKSKWTKL